MTIKNPYKLIEKANDTFNLYLEKYEDIDEFISSSKKEHHAYESKLEEINNNLLQLLSELIKENQNNKDLINNLSNKINEKINTLENKTDIKLNELNRDIKETINNETNNQINNINKLESNIKETINTESNNLLNNINKLEEIQNEVNQEHLSHYNTIKEILNSQVDVRKNLDTAVKLFTRNYDACKMYFFNNNEKELKKYLNTDDLFRLCYFNNIQFLSYSPSENKILLRTKEGIILGTNNRFCTINEVIGFDGYSVPQLYQFKEFVVFDIGMNRGYASLRFAEFENCASVYGFEIDDNTYNKAIYNINLNPNLSKKIKPYNFGLSNVNKEITLYYLKGADGLNTVKQEFIDIQYELKGNKEKIKTKLVEVKNASEIIGKIIEKDKITSNIVLKIDTEGSEYDIIDDLINSGIINKIDLILGEGHNFNNQDITKKLSDLGFEEIEKTDNIITYNFAYVRKEYYDIWQLIEYL